jgi:Protein of unknown function (DUF2852)
MGMANNAMGGSYGAREFGPGEWASARWRRGASRWTAFEIIAMVLGFIVFWPIGLAILGYKFWQSRYGGPDLQTLAADKWQDARSMMGSGSWGSSWGCGRAMRRGSRFYSAPTGNIAFDEWRTAGLARLDEERRKLDEAQREFAEYVEAIRRAKDREEFERFMAERRARSTNGGGEAR